jgi:hypothetical protein
LSELEGKVDKLGEELQAARAAKLELERLKMASEQLTLDLKQEKLRLEEQVLEAEEQALTAQEEADEKDGVVLEAKEAQMKAEIKAEEVLARLKQTDSRAHELQVKVDSLQRQAEEAHAEVASLEEEKYRMGDDIEAMEEELEEANAQIKKYYEAVADRDANLMKRAAEVEDLQRRVQRAEYEKELLELRQNPVEEGGEGDLQEVYAQLDEQKRTIEAREKEVNALTAELDAYRYAVDEAPSPGVGGRRQPLGAMNVGEDSDDFGTVQAREKANEDAALRRKDAEAKHTAMEAQKAAQATLALQRRAEAAESAANEARRACAAAEASARQKEADVLKLMGERDAARAGIGVKGTEELEEKVGEMEDELYQARADLEEEQQRSKDLETELDSLREQARNGAELRELQMELEDVRAAKEKAEAMLARAIGGS